jgi:hypothetical protein
VISAPHKPAARSSRSCTCRAPCTPPACAYLRRHVHVQAVAGSAKASQFALGRHVASKCGMTATC